MPDLTSEPAFAARLRSLVDGAEPRLRSIADDASAARPAPGKWSPREVIGHLIDSASNNHQRFVRAAFQDDLIFTGYDQDEWVSLQRYNAQSWPDLITLWCHFNHHIASVMTVVPRDVMTRSHTRHNLDQIAFRTDLVPVEPSLEFFMNDYVDHLEHHLNQILRGR